MTNAQFEFWFSNGKMPEALCGFGEYFVPDVTYREEHDFVLAVGQLLEWAKFGDSEDAAKGFEIALARLFEANAPKSAIRLLLSYGILSGEMAVSLPLNEVRIGDLFARFVTQAGNLLARDEGLRDLLLSLIRYFPFLANRVGIESPPKRRISPNLS